MVKWSYFDKFDEIINKYMPNKGEGETMASQLVTAINKLVYKWYNDGDVFDNTSYLQGWANDLSSYANWIATYIKLSDEILDKVYDCKNDDDYEDLLQELADLYLDEWLLSELNKREKIGSIYDCEGKYKFEEYTEEDEEWY